ATRPLMNPCFGKGGQACVAASVARKRTPSNATHALVTHALVTHALLRMTQLPVQDTHVQDTPRARLGRQNHHSQDGEWAKPRTMFTQIRNASDPDLDQFQDTSKWKKRRNIRHACGCKMT